MTGKKMTMRKGHPKARWILFRPSTWLRRGKFAEETPGNVSSKASGREPGPPRIATNPKSNFEEIQAALASGEESPPAIIDRLTRYSYFLPRLSRPPTYDARPPVNVDRPQPLKLDHKEPGSLEQPSCSTQDGARQSSPALKRSGEQKSENAPTNATVAAREANRSEPCEVATASPTGATEGWEVQMVSLQEIGPRKKAWAFHKGLICVLPSEAKLPWAAERSWCNEIRDRLWHDLEPARRRISRKCSSCRASSNCAVVELELRMSGHVRDEADTVECSPAVWILCGSSIGKRIVDNAVEKMTWLHDSRFSLEVHVGASTYAAVSLTQGTVSLSHLHLKYPIALPDGRKLHLHIEDQTKKFSASGRLICATIVEEDNFTLVDQRISRLGGFIKIDEHPRFGVTTAHGIADHLIPQPAASDHSRDDSCDSDSDTESPPDALKEPAGCCGTLSGSTSEEARLGYKNPADVDLWMPVSSTGAVNFLGQGAEAMASGAAWWSRLRVGKDRFQEQADFALLANIEDHFQTSNRYLSDDRVPRNISEVNWNNDAGVVQILADGQSPVSALLLPSEKHRYVRSDGLETRRIQAELPLASGVSGSWVVRDGALCGMIAAINEREPFAHMIEAQRLFSDIKSSSTGAQNVGLSVVDDSLSNKSEVAVKLSVTPSEPEPETKARAKIGRQGSTVTITISPGIHPVLEPEEVDSESEVKVVGADRVFDPPGTPQKTNGDRCSTPAGQGSMSRRWAFRVRSITARIRHGQFGRG
ncbi:hypothetical protein QBC34DRAFT_391006 [Podospora aff. communis PSN243]|uniref:Uncharacterized protein n=1 Tax=Podospora aff. communis PSN243 TaxID=3040156 RepID=A0AAV9H2I9_9PEZI|nr:hypothetical protein QBC34DRAFT_391006 [Podospora aff. communis PSN243]